MSIAHKISVDEYDAWTAEGRFEPREEHHVELLYGEVVAMSPAGPFHADILAWLAEWSAEVTRGRGVLVRVQMPLRLVEFQSQPEPDIAWVKRERYRRRHPEASDTYLVIEVGHSSVASDREIKSKLYAAAGIPEYWLVDIANRTVEVRRDPEASGYASLAVLQVGELARPAAWPEIDLEIAELF